MEVNIVSIAPVEVNGNREVHVRYDDGNIVKIGAYADSWGMWNAPARHRWLTVDVANKCNKWIQGIGEFPYEPNSNVLKKV